MIDSKQDFVAVMHALHSEANSANVAGMARYGIRTEHALGIPMPRLRALAQHIGKQHTLALQLWDSGIHEARILAVLIDDPALLTSRQMDTWAADFDSWDVTDQCCNNLFSGSVYATDKVRCWAASKAEFVRRAAFALLASLAVHDTALTDEDFIAFLPLITEAATDERNFVKKSVNWALRQIGKRNLILHGACVETARAMLTMESKAARWIARDALRELTRQECIDRIGKKQARSAEQRGRRPKRQEALVNTVS
jgi:3-methyladenine DNA glycosylase AlkD